jgi:alginate O-acetyltransferase complex protein AlgJ
MRPLVIVQSSLFAALVLGVAAAAGTRAVPFERPANVDWVDGRLAKAFESHYDAAFPGKTLGVNLWAAIDYVLFNEGRPGVVVGQQGWLYTDEEFKGYENAERTVATHLALIPWVRDELERQGTQLVVAVVPSKARIYPEHLGDRRPAALHAGLYARAQQALRDAGIAAPDLARVLTACKRQGPTFMRTDTHWTPAGAQCVARAVEASAPADLARRGGATKFRTDTTGTETYRGDLFKFLPLDPYFAALLPSGEPLEVRRTHLASATDADGLLGDPAAPPIVLIGTSYSADERWNLTGALQEAFQDDVANYADKGKGPFIPMLDYLLNSRDLPLKPRLVVWEIPERYLPVAQDLRVTRTVPPAACNGDGRPNSGSAAARPANETL